MRTSERRRPASPFRYSPLIAAFACVFSQGSLAAPTPFPVTVGGDGGTGSLRWALTEIIIDECANPDGYYVEVTGGPFVVSVSSPLPTVGCSNVQIVGNDNITIQPLLAFYGGICGLQASPASGLTKISGVTVQNFSYSGLGAGMCGKLDATGNTVTGNDLGFSLTGGANIVGNTISQNLIKGVYDSVGGSTISQNTIQGNGLGISGPDAMVVTGNLVHNNGGSGVEVGANALVTGNTVHSNSWRGIAAGDAALVKGNTVYGHVEGAGIEIATGTVGGPLPADRNVVYGNWRGIYVSSSGTIENNYIGVTADGNPAAGNGEGIYVIGATTLTIKNNVISGNTNSGIYAFDIGTLTIQGNKVGTDASGTLALGNGYGIDVSYSYGGPIANNVVAANSNGGISLFETDLAVSNNQIGGAGTLQNGGDGLEIKWVTGGSVTNNIISGNVGNGFSLYASSNVTISGNKIGTDASGTVGIANTVSGIEAVNSDSLSITGNQISSNSGPGVTISGFGVLGAGNMLVDNVIAHNSGDGVYLVNGASNNTITGSVSGQSIHSNNGKNINLDYSPGPRPNNVPETSGPNGGQNRPNIVSVFEDSGSTVIQGSLLSFAPGSVFVNDLPFNGQFEFDLYGNDISGVPAGKTWLGKATATTNLSGVATFNATIAGTGFGHITATATGPFGTSEFSDTLPALVPAASITPMNVPFGNVVVGATVTTPTEVAFRSNGTGNYLMDSISQGATAPTCPATSSPVCATGDFSCSVSCTVATPYPPLGSPTLPPSCTISGLSFHPSATGAQTTTLWICDNTSASARAITFTGTGVPHVVTASQGAHDFGNVSIGTQVASPSILVTNGSGNPPATLGTPIVAAPFSVGSNTCGSSLAPGASCNFTVVYAPTVVGPSTGVFSMTVANGNPVVVDLQGAGVSTAVGQLPLPSGIDFGTALLASGPLQHALTLQNMGNGPVTFSSITVTEPFQMSHNCPASLAPSASCIVNLSFAPLVYGNTTGELVVSSDAGSGNQVVTLLATVAGTRYTLSPWDHSFGAVPVGSTSPPRAIAVSNNGENTIPLSGFAVTGPYTIVSNDCGANLAPASFCTAELVFEPVVPGPVGGTFTAQVGLTGAPPAVATLSGTGTQQAILVLPDAIDFGAILRGSVPSVVRAVELRNTGNATLTFSTGTSGPFGLSGDCGSSLAPSAACNLTITFAPSTVGDFAGSLDIVSNAPGGSGSIPITARVQAQLRPDLRVDASEMGFGDRMIGTRSGLQRVTVSNVGLVEAQLGVLPPTRDFITTSQCGAILAPGASCTVDVVFMPMATGLRYNQLQFTSDAPGSPFGVDLSGRGCSPPRPGRPPSCN